MSNGNHYKIEDENICLTGDCIACGACYNVCPGIELTLENRNITKLGSEYLGSYLKCYSSFAVDPIIRQNGSSGGVAISLSSYLLKERLVNMNMIVAVRGIRGNDSKVSIQLTNLTTDIEKSAGSKYLLVSLSNVLQELSSLEGQVDVFG